MRNSSVRPCAAVAFALLSAGSVAVSAPPPVAVFTAGGPSKLVLRRVATISSRRSWSVQDFGDGSGRLTRLEGDPLHVAVTKKGSTYTLKLDAAALTAFAGELEAALEARIQDGATVTIVKQQVTARDSRQRTARRISAKLTVDAAVGTAAPVRGTFTFTGNGVPRRVLVLDDSSTPADGSASEVSPALAKAGHFPIDGGFYQTWDGFSPTLDGVDAVFLLQGVEYDDTMTANGDAALAAWVRAGGGLLRTEWGLYEAAASPALAVDFLLPAVSPESDYAYGSRWSVLRRTHPLARGLKKRFEVPLTGWAKATPIDGATVVVKNDSGYPMVTTARFDAGTVVHVNHDLRYSTSPIQPEILRILVNAATFLRK